MRLDSDVVAWLKSGGSGYQTKANWLLRSAMLQMEEGAAHRRVARRKKKAG
jgi:hypothetical protein